MEHFNNETTMQCYKIPDNVVGNFKISCDTTCSKVVLWSKYQLLIYKDLNFRTHENIETQFEIVDVIVMKDYLLCLDVTGNLNILDSFIIWKQNVKCICHCNTFNKQYLVSLQFEQNRFTLLLNEFCMNDSPNENISKKFTLPQENWMTVGESIIMACEYVNSKYSERLKHIFKLGGNPKSDYLLLIISIDKRNVYAVLYSLDPNLQLTSDTLVCRWVKLHKSYSDVIGIKIIITDEIRIFVGLSKGNILRIPLLLTNHKLEVFHLNTAIHKFAIIHNTVIYTDTLTMWKNENAFSESDFKFEQFKVRNVRDFCLINNQVICNTFSNFIYTLKINHSSSYITLDSDDTCSVEMITNSDYLQELMETIRKNEEILQKINRESEYLMALSLSKRQDLMDDLIRVTASVFDDYRELSLKNTNLTLTDEHEAYCSSKSYYFLVNVLVNRVQHKLNKLLSDVLGDIKIHITLSECGVLKTTSIQIKEELTTTNYVIPLKRKNMNINRMQVNVKIITNVPGKYDENHQHWTVLYHKCIVLKAENFITIKTNNNNIHLKDDEDALDLLINKRAEYLYDKEYEFRISDPIRYEWTLYVKLPDCNLKMKDILRLINPLSSKKAYNSLQHLGKMFRDKNCLEFQVGKDQVKLNIEDDNLKVTCQDITVASDIRNFFSMNIFNSCKGQLGEKLIEHKFYSVIENLKRDLNVYVERRVPKEEFAKLVTKFLKNVYCLIPI